MWVRLWIALGVSSSVLSQQTNTRVQHGGASFGWGWQLSSQGEGPATVGHYYVKLPQSEQQVRFSGDGAFAVPLNTTNQNQHQHHHQVHTTHLAQGHNALQLKSQQIQSQGYQNNAIHNATQPQPGNNQGQPVDIYLLQQQFTSPAQPQLVQPIPTPSTVQYNNPPNYYDIKPLYNFRTQHPIQNQYINEQTRNENLDSSQPLQQEENSEQNHNYSPTTIVQVFKNHNCSGDANLDNTSDDLENDIRKSKELFAELPQYEIHDINSNSGAKDATRRPLTYRGAVHFRVETPRPQARNERYYYTIDDVSATETYNSTKEGINKLVASTQDLISNEDLLKINHSVEKLMAEQSEDIIKPRPKHNYRTESRDFRQGNSNQITVKANIANIIKSDIDHLENDQNKEQVLQTSSNEYRFASPIVVADTPYVTYKNQIVNNLVSTMVPYLQNGYEIIGVKNSLDESEVNNSYKETSEELVNVTPRPIGQKYLAPITVALRLLNANVTEVYNTVDDHEASDSEFIPDTVKRPEKTRTIVEIQESIPGAITHINDVEVHEYLDEGRSNNKGPYDTAKSLYNKYVEAFESSKKIQQNMNDILDKYESLRNDKHDNSENSNRNDNEEEPKDNLEQSENTQSEVEVRPNGDDLSNERSEYVSYYNNYENENRKIIQPIIIEKEVPVTKFVDRYIERQVPYPETVEVQVPVDRPVPVAVPYEKVVEKPYEITRYVDKPYPVEVPRPYPVEVKVPYPVEQKVYIDRPVHVPYPVEKIVEKQVLHPVPVPTPVGIPYEVRVPVEHKVLYPIAIDRPVPVPIEIEKQVPVDRIVHKEVPVPYPVEKRVPYPVHYETKVPVPYPVERRVPVPVERIVEKPVTVTKVVEKPVHIEVPVPHPVPVAVHVSRPYPVDRIVEKKVPYPVPVDRIVEKKVPVPYPVEKVIETIVEKPYVVTKYVDKPYPVEKRVPYPVEKIVEKKVPYPVQVPIHVKVPYPVEKIVERPVHIPVPVYHRYRQAHQHEAEESKNYPQYQNLYKPDVKDSAYANQNHKNTPQQAKAYATQLYENLKEKQNKSVQSTYWGNQYASSYQYINNTPEIKDNFKKSQSLSNYLEYLTNKQNSPYSYYGPVPLEHQNDMWERNNDEMKLRRADRTPKVTNLRIEYGGFKPPLIPSTEIDLDGMPVNKD